ncbi:MAG: quinolinate synthase NadA, partial [Akkermansia sp.]|nr:quinolinate synthase NadA [Akkermansia sp.]
VTETGILHRLRALVPGKEFIPVSEGAASCAECEYMKLNSLEKLRDCLRDMAPVVRIDEDLRRRAERPLLRMLELSK